MSEDLTRAYEDAWDVISEVRDRYPRLGNDAPTDEIVEALADAGLLVPERATPADLPRLRRHADGRWVILADPGDPQPWLTHPLQTAAGPITEAVDWLTDAQVHEPGWSELAVGAQPSRAVLNAEIAAVLDRMVKTARGMGEERTAIFIDGNAMPYRDGVS